MSVLAQFAQAADYYNEYETYSTYTPEEAATVAVVGGMFFIFALFIGLIAYAVHAFLLGRIFKKAGVEQWIAWVPFYNGWKLLEIGGQQGFWAVLAIIPFVNFVSLIFMYIAMYNIGLKLQKEGWFVILAIFIPLVWFIWLAFDDSKWQGAKATVAAPSAKAEKSEEDTPEETK